MAIELKWALTLAVVWLLGCAWAKGEPEGSTNWWIGGVAAAIGFFGGLWCLLAWVWSL